VNLKYLIIVLMLFPTIQLSAQEAQEEANLKTQKERLSYSIGVNAGKSLKSMEINLDLELVIQALRDAYSGSKLLMSEEEIRNVLIAYQKERLEKQAEATKLLAEKNKKEGDAFLAENKTKEGVVTLASGLQYKIIKAGEGNKPNDGDTVRVHYRGTLIDGTEFDSSFRRGKPASFRLGNVIAGWTEALKLMPVGSKWQLFIPPDLAYGTRGTGRAIGPNATLIFEVELLAIEPNAK
jgi:FKBP-type peptidyl-prolyl cis-trans isomerase